MPQFRHGLLLLCCQMFFFLALASTVVNHVMGITDHMQWTSLMATAVIGMSYLYLRNRPDSIDGPAILIILMSIALVSYGWFHFGGILGSGPSLLFPMAGLSLLLTTLRRQQLALLCIVLISSGLLAASVFYPDTIGTYYPSQAAMLQDMAVSQFLGILIVGALFIRISSHHLRGWEELSQQQQANLLLLQANAERAEHELLERIALTRRMGDSLAHDINNLLTVIQVSAEMIETPGEAESRQTILDSSMTAGRLVERYRQQQAGATENLDIKPILMSLTRSVSCLAPQVDVTLSFSWDTPRLNASRVDLERVIMNLCLNAIQSMKGSGQLRIEVNKRDNEQYEIVVTDSGQGISAEVLPFIFDPFFTTKKTTGGTGIGLSNVRQIVEQWGGHIEASNTADHGAQFTLRLPVA